MRELLGAALGKEPSDVALKNCRYVCVFDGTVRRGDVAVKNGVVVGVGGSFSAREEIDLGGAVVLPGLIDGHVHIESSYLLPGAYARAVVPHGTAAVIADPHEIANVLGEEGVRFLARASERLPLDIRLQVPSCVPAAPIGDGGAALDSRACERLLGDPAFFGLGEVMNDPGVLAGDGELWEKIEAASRLGKKIDGHAPGLTGRELSAYLLGGISTDHESRTREEAEEKAAKGMYVLVRETEVAKAATDGNFRRFVLCTDDRSAAELRSRGHIDASLRELRAAGIDPVRAVVMATLNAAECYGLGRVGAVAPGYAADLAVVRDLRDFEVTAVYRRGKLVARDGKPLFDAPAHGERLAPSVHAAPVSEETFRFRPSGKVKVIRTDPKSIFTAAETRDVRSKDGDVDLAGTDLVKVAAIDRHRASGESAVGLLAGYGLRGGAVALTVAHDSHNLLVVGDGNADMALAANEVIRSGGGVAVAAGGAVKAALPLGAAGLMSYAGEEEVADRLEDLWRAAREAGAPRDADPFRALTFLSLVVLPELRITTKGLFDNRAFAFTETEA